MDSNVYKHPDSIDWELPIVIDFESYYDKLWNLSKITTEKYIRGSQWECIGVSIKVGTEEAKFYKLETGIPVLRNLVKEKPLSPFVSHNNMFDMAILGLRYGIYPRFMVDTALLAKLCGLDRVAGSASLASLSKYMMKMGLYTREKGVEVHNMLGVHASDMTEQQWVKYGNYCKLDSELCYQLYVMMLPKVPLSELLAVDLTTKMFVRPMFDIDVDMLTVYAEKLEQNRDSYINDLALKCGYTDVNTFMGVLRSSAKFADLLTSLGVQVPVKYSPRKDCLIPALSKTDLGFLSLLEHEDPFVQEVVNARLDVASNMEKTRTETFLDVASRGLAPVYLRYGSAHTLRYGGGQKTNYQNLSKRVKDPVLRRAHRAPKGYVIVASDSSQIEARINAYLSQQHDLTNLFIEKRDPYIDMATAIFNKSYEEIYQEAKVAGTKEGKRMRNLGKEAVLACGYGMSANTFRNRMIISGNTEAADMADTIVAAYRSKNNCIVAFWKKCNVVLDILYAGGNIWFGGSDDRPIFYADGSSRFHGVRIPSVMLPNGTYLWFHNLRKETGDDGKINYVYDQFTNRNKFIATRIWGSKLVENVCQALAFAILKYQALKIAESGVPINLNVHDEWVSIVSRKYALEAVVAHYIAMSNVPDYIPNGLLACEVDVGLNYADLHTIDVDRYTRV